MIKAALNFLAIGVCVLHLPIASQAVTITPAPAPATEPCTTACTRAPLSFTSSRTFAKG